MTEDEYSAMLQKQEEHLIKIKRQAIVQKGTLRNIPLPDRLDSHRERDIFLTGWERTGSVPQAAAISEPQSFRRFWGVET